MSRLRSYLFATLLTLGSLAFGATPTGRPVQVTTTSSTVYVQAGWNRLTCTSDVYYLLVSAYTGTVTSSTGTLLRGPTNRASLGTPGWILVTSNPWLALILRSGTDATCMLETVSMDGSAGSFTTLAASGTLAVTGAATLSSTLAVTGGSTLTGNTTVGGTFGVTGATTLSSTLAVTGASTLTGNVTAVGSLTNSGDNIIGGGTKTRGRITLDGASPAVGTATVNTGAFCMCSNETTQANPVKCAVSSTTLTATGPNAATDSVAYICIQ